MASENPRTNVVPGSTPGTFSIAAHDSEAEEFGVAVSTALVGVGALCPFVSANAAVATQSIVEVEHGRRALRLVDEGVGIATACDALLTADTHANYRQLHGIDRTGEQFTFTGDDCIEWCGSTTGENHTIAGNMLSGEDVLEAMSTELESTDGELAYRLLSSLEAGMAAGGDKRGKISAALLVYSPTPQLYHNLRVDRSESPVTELRETFEFAKETQADTYDRLQDAFGDIPEELVNYGVKY